MFVRFFIKSYESNNEIEEQIRFLLRIVLRLLALFRSEENESKVPLLVADAA
jgi:hypothetical protein